MPRGVAAVDGGGERWTAGTVVAAVPWFALAGLFEPAPPELSKIVSRASAMASSPIVTVNLWFDRPVLDEPFIGLPGRAMQWVFDKRAVFGEGASHLSLVSSGASPLVDLTNDAARSRPRTRNCSRRCPAVRPARLLRATVVREPRATFSLAPGQPPRPETQNAGPRTVSGGRLDRHRSPGYDRERGPLGTQRRRTLALGN